MAKKISRICKASSLAIALAGDDAEKGAPARLFVRAEQEGRSYRVGVSTTANMAEGSFASFCNIGTAKAHVLPDPYSCISLVGSQLMAPGLATDRPATANTVPAALQYLGDT